MHCAKQKWSSTATITTTTIPSIATSCGTKNSFDSLFWTHTYNESHNPCYTDTKYKVITTANKSNKHTCIAYIKFQRASQDFLSRDMIRMTQHLIITWYLRSYLIQSAVFVGRFNIYLSVWWNIYDSLVFETLWCSSSILWCNDFLTHWTMRLVLLFYTNK